MSAGLVALATVCSLNLHAQVVNGDFSAGTNGWNIVFPPSNIYPPAYGLAQLDMDGPGPLPVSQAFWVQVGDSDLLNLQQSVNLTTGVSYNFFANLAMVPHAFNADGGTITVYIGPTMLSSYSFGYVTSLTQNEYAVLSTNYTPSVSGPQTLSINFSRGFGTDADTPSDYIDNISLQAPVAPPLNIQLSGGNEVMLMPYYVASMNIEHAYLEAIGKYEPFEGVCLVDTFQMAEKRQTELSFFNEKNSARVNRQKKAPIRVMRPRSHIRIRRCDKFIAVRLF